jgi:hypothetical protein
MFSSHVKKKEEESKNRNRISSAIVSKPEAIFFERKSSTDDEAVKLRLDHVCLGYMIPKKDKKDLKFSCELLL